MKKFIAKAGLLPMYLFGGIGGIIIAYGSKPLGITLVVIGVAFLINFIFNANKF